MAATATEAQAPIRLDWSQKDKRVVVTPADNDRYVLTVESAVAACGAFQNQIRFGEQFGRVLQSLALWARHQKSLVDSAYLSVHDKDLLFLVVQKQPKYNPSLEKALTDLDIEIANNGDCSLVRLNVLAVPPASRQALGAFLHPEHTLLVYAHAQ